MKFKRQEVDCRHAFGPLLGLLELSIFLFTVSMIKDLLPFLWCPMLLTLALWAVMVILSIQTLIPMVVVANKLTVIVAMKLTVIVSMAVLWSVSIFVSCTGLARRVGGSPQYHASNPSSKILFT